MSMEISQASFDQIRAFAHSTAGIIIGAEKSAMVTGRLWRRLQACGCADYDTYLAFVTSPAGQEERALMLDLLTTNETYFFREPAHFRLLSDEMIPRSNQRPFRVWCAAASSGQEPYSLAMVLTDCLGLSGWSMLATDISRRVLQTAEEGIYRMERLDQMPPEYLRKYCLKGVGDFDGRMVVSPQLRQQIRFQQHNLLKPLASDAQFDVIFLRNVLIYFDQNTKQRVLNNLLQNLRPGGWLVLGHCESLTGLTNPLDLHQPSVYRKPQAEARAFALRATA